MDYTLLFGFLAACGPLLLVIIGIHEVRLQYGKHFSYVIISIESEEKKIKISLRNEDIYKSVVDGIYIYCFGTEVPLPYTKEVLENQKDDRYMDGRSEKILIIKKEDLELAKIKTLKIMDETNDSFFNRLYEIILDWEKKLELQIKKYRKTILERSKILKKIYTGEESDGDADADLIKNNFSFKLLIRSSGQTFITRKWITTESVKYAFKKSNVSIEQENIELTKRDHLINAAKRYYKGPNWDIRPLTETGQFKRRRWDPIRMDNIYVTPSAILMVSILLVVQMVFDDIFIKIVLLLLAIPIMMLAILYRASSGINRVVDRITFFIICSVALSGVFINLNLLPLDSIIFGGYISFLSIFPLDITINKFSGRSGRLIFRRVKK